MSALVSVIIPTYKRPNTLIRAINSVLNQTYKDIEIIVVDANDPESSESKDTELTMSKYQMNKKISYYKLNKQVNGSVARNVGIKNAKGAYVAFLDDDDEFLPEKIEFQVKKLEELNSEWGIAYTRFIRMKNDVFFDKSLEKKEGFINEEILSGEFFASVGSNIMIRKEVAESIGGFDETLLRKQDLDFLYRANLDYKIAHVPINGLIVHKDDNSNKPDSKTLINTIHQFLNSFENHIKQLPVSKRDKIKKSQYLYVVRFYIMKGNFYEALKISRKYNISLLLIVRYLNHLFVRKITKKCYGFRID